MSLRPLRPFAQFIGGVTESFDADAAAYIAAVETADGQALESAVRNAVNAFVVGCKADQSPNAGVSNWAALKCCGFLAGPRTLAGALVPLLGGAPTNSGFVSGDYVRATGLQGNGINKQLTTVRDATTDPQNNRHLAVWQTIPEPRTATKCPLGVSSGTNNQLLTTTTSRYFRLCGDASIADATSVSGFYGASRNSAANVVGRYSGTSQTISSVSSAAVSALITVFSRNGTSYATARQSWYSIGEAVDLAALDSRLSAYMTAIAGIS